MFRLFQYLVGVDSLDDIASVLTKYLNQHTLLICNTDLSHVNGHFKDKIKYNICEQIRQQDSDIVKFLLSNNS